MKKYYRILMLLCAFCVTLTLVACDRREVYRPSKYTKVEARCLYFENRELFESLAIVISSNEAFFEKGRINEYTDVDIISPYDDALQFFHDADLQTINTFFNLKPYMILYDYARRFVEVTFLGSDGEESYNFLFWTSDSEDSAEKFNAHRAYLAQRYTLEVIHEDRVIFYYEAEE